MATVEEVKSWLKNKDQETEHAAPIPTDSVTPETVESWFVSGRKKTKPPEKLRNLAEEALSALGAGVVSTGESLAGTAEMIGVPGAGSAREYLQELGESETLRRPEYLQHGDVLSNPERLADWRWWVRSLGENLPNMAAMMAPGFGAIKVGQAVAKARGLATMTAQGLKATQAGMKLIRGAGIAGAWTGAASVEAGAAYSQAKKEMEDLGYDDETIERVATAEGLVVGAVNGVLEVIPFDKLMFKGTGTDKLLKRAIKQALVEGKTEAAQEVVNVIAEMVGHKPNQKALEIAGRVVESAIVGAVLGGGAGAVFEGEGEQEEISDPKSKISKGGGQEDRNLVKSAQEQPLTNTGQAITDVGDEPARIEEHDRKVAEQKKKLANLEAKDILNRVIEEEEASRAEVEKQREEEVGKSGSQEVPEAETGGMADEGAQAGRMERVLGEEAPDDRQAATPGGTIPERGAGERTAAAGGGGETGEGQGLGLIEDIPGARQKAGYKPSVETEAPEIPDMGPKPGERLKALLYGKKWRMREPQEKTPERPINEELDDMLPGSVAYKGILLSDGRSYQSPKMTKDQASPFLKRLKYLDTPLWARLHFQGACLPIP